MNTAHTRWQTELARDGYTVLPAVFSEREVAAILESLAAAFAGDQSGSTLRTEDGFVYGARNLMQLWPGVISAWRKSPLPELLADTLGANFGLVRVLYFDKPPEQSWALPWHR